MHVQPSFLIETNRVLSIWVMLQSKIQSIHFSLTCLHIDLAAFSKINLVCFFHTSPYLYKVYKFYTLSAVHCHWRTRLYIINKLRTVLRHALRERKNPGYSFLKEFCAAYHARKCFLKGVEGGGGGHVPPHFQKWGAQVGLYPPPHTHFWTERMF